MSTCSMWTSLARASQAIQEIMYYLRMRSTHEDAIRTWQLAGFEGPYGMGLLQRPIDMEPWPLLEDVRVDRGWLTAQAPGPIHLSQPSPEPLADLTGHWMDRFLDLAQGTDEEIEAFATKRGLLGLCRHGLPYTHSIAS